MFKRIKKWWFRKRDAERLVQLLLRSNRVKIFVYNAWGLEEKQIGFDLVPDVHLDEALQEIVDHLKDVRLNPQDRVKSNSFKEVMERKSVDDFLKEDLP